MDRFRNFIMLLLMFYSVSIFAGDKDVVALENETLVEEVSNVVLENDALPEEVSNTDLADEISKYKLRNRISTDDFDAFKIVFYVVRNKNDYNKEMWKKILNLGKDYKILCRTVEDDSFIKEFEEVLRKVYMMVKDEVTIDGGIKIMFKPEVDDSNKILTDSDFVEVV